MIHPVVMPVFAMANPHGFPMAQTEPPSIIPSPITAKMLRSSIKFARVSWVFDGFCTTFELTEKRDRNGIWTVYEWDIHGIFHRGIFIWYDIWLVVYHPLINHGVRQLGWIDIPNCFWKNKTCVPNHQLVYNHHIPIVVGLYPVFNHY